MESDSYASRVTLRARQMDAVKRKRTMVEETYDILVNAICSGELSSGERLNQDEIAVRLKVSRQPVNSAILDLSRFGAAPLIAYCTAKEMSYGTNTDGRIS